LKFPARRPIYLAHSATRKASIPGLTAASTHVTTSNGRRAASYLHKPFQGGNTMKGYITAGVAALTSLSMTAAVAAPAQASTWRPCYPVITGKTKYGNAGVYELFTAGPMDCHTARRTTARWMRTGDFPFSRPLRGWRCQAVGSGVGGYWRCWDGRGRWVRFVIDYND
jgi:hypothetical protein